MQTLLLPRIGPARLAPTVAFAIALLCLPVAILLAFTWAQTAVISVGDGEVQRDWAQKVFYIHVPIAFAAYWGFIVGAWNALLYLLKGADEYDIRSYVGVHVGIVFGCLVMVTGSLWAKAAWGVWWQWGDRQLLVFLILFLYYCAYFMVRFSLDAGEHRARVSAVVTLLGIVLVPLSFMAVRIAETLIHPTVITSDGLAMTGEMGATFAIASLGMLALATGMMYLESAGKLIDAGLGTARPGRREHA